MPWLNTASSGEIRCFQDNMVPGWVRPASTHFAVIVSTEVDPRAALTFAHSFLHTLSRSHTLTLSRPQALILSQALVQRYPNAELSWVSLSRSLYHSLSLTHTHTHTRSVTHAHSLTLTHSPSHTLTLSLSHSHTLTLSHTRTRSQALVTKYPNAEISWVQEEPQNMGAWYPPLLRPPLPPPPSTPTPLRFVLYFSRA